MNNKGLTYIELLVALGISGAIGASVAGACMKAKDKATEMTNEHIAVYQDIDKAVNSGEIPETLKGCEGYEQLF